ncbi:copper chaperone PCu(A)C [uncultured Roseicyclus sp.]|jgi:periplasmic copper chaperone A|uniref:copper chaperone PCu(A)C n=1 Tax=uncultured Roseicyclus sp. TaxID=543072 RepID=UPI00260C0C93|nr:copper chaperone PCu(A)C [uncultured Roseicyclus sp.]
MSLKLSLNPLFLAAALALLPGFAHAQMQAHDAYARAASAMAVSGAAFMAVTNPTRTDDRILAVRSDVADRIELHTHLQTAEGVMRMVKLDDGIALPAGQTVLLERGGLHIMFLGLTRPLNHGDAIELTLEFEHAEPLTVSVPVDLERMPSDGGAMQQDNGHHGHGSHGHQGHAQGSGG